MEVIDQQVLGSEQTLMSLDQDSVSLGPLLSRSCPLLKGDPM